MASLSEREAELWRRNEELERRQQEVQNAALEQDAIFWGDVASNEPTSPPRGAAKTRPQSARTSKSKSRTAVRAGSAQSRARPSSTRTRPSSTQSRPSALPGPSDVPRSSAREDVTFFDTDALGSETSIRLLKTQLAALQGERDRMANELDSKNEMATVLEAQLKAAKSEGAALHRTNTSLQSQLEKQRKLTEDLKKKNNTTTSRLIDTQKELEAALRAQQQNNRNREDPRVARLQEELDRYRNKADEAAKSQADSLEEARRRIDRLQAEQKKMEKQKNELLAAFKKQLKLIDVLKRQKIHLQAAKLLSLSEEEFSRVLDVEM